MTPTLAGRLQTRWVLVFWVGIPWLLLAAPWLPGLGNDPIISRYAAGTYALCLVAVLGIGWECVYHGLQQLRWDKDWPIGFGLAVVIPEGLVVRWIGETSIAEIVPSVPAFPFWVLFGSTWLLMWLVANGPLRVISLRWRYSGGQWW